MIIKKCKQCSNIYIPKKHDTNSKYCSKECRDVAYTFDGKKEKHLETSKKWKNRNKTRVKLYSIWQNIKKRCFDSTYKEFYLYGGRGITMCQEWMNDFESFYDWAKLNGYKNYISKNKKRNYLSIDRIDNSKGYSPENCRWVDDITQARNKRTSSRSKTGIAGVKHYRNGYRVTISVNFKQKHIGCFKTFEDAVIARKNAEKMYWGM